MIISDISSKPSFGKSVRTLEVSTDLINAFYAQGHYELGECDIQLWPNQPLILKAGPQSALALVSKEGTHLIKLKEKIAYFDVEPRNTEQAMLFNLLHNPDIRVMVVTGAAGTGKSLLLSAYALQSVIKTHAWKRLLLSKPLEVTTGTKYWGTVPGDAGDKFAPFLRSYNMTFASIVGRHGMEYLEVAREKKAIEFFPLELMRGVSLKDAIVWYDEVQNLNAHEMQTLGSRVDDVGNTKILLSGDIKQRDKRIQKRDTGLRLLTESPHFLKSPFTAHVHLDKIERGVVAQLFHDVFDDGE